MSFLLRGFFQNITASRASRRVGTWASRKCNPKLNPAAPTPTCGELQRKKKVQGVFAVGIRVQELRGSGFRDFGSRVWGFGGLWMKTL